jgi:hypothetical protein
MNLPHRGVSSPPSPPFGEGSNWTETRRTGIRFRSGEYLASTSQLFQVESCGETRAVIENCSSGDLIDVAIDELLSLRHVEPGAR